MGTRLFKEKHFFQFQNLKIFQLQSSKMLLSGKNMDVSTNLLSISTVLKTHLISESV